MRRSSSGLWTLDSRLSYVVPIVYAAGANINRPLPILIFGASARAAAHSAVRAGMRPVCADLFGDVDLREAAEALPIERYPDDFRRVSESASASAWMYTGGLENYPQIVSAVSAGRVLWGNPASVLTKIRDPLRVYEVLRKAGQPAADVRADDDPPPPDDEWMLKPIGGAGGSGIRIWNSGAADSSTLLRPHYFQRRMTGLPCSAVFLATGQTAYLAGVTRQFVGTRVLGAAPFAYCGSLGPFRLPGPLRRELAETGRFLANAFRLRGLFGVDAMFDGRTIRLSEVNPRYTASVEVLEHALSLPLLDWHRRACELYETGSESLETDRRFVAAIERAEREQRKCVGKAIVFAVRDVVTPSLDAFRNLDADGLPAIADVPQVDSPLRRGQPICTVFAAGPERSICLRNLAERVRRVRRHISANGYS